MRKIPIIFMLFFCFFGVKEAAGMSQNANNLIINLISEQWQNAGQLDSSSGMIDPQILYPALEKPHDFQSCLNTCVRLLYANCNACLTTQCSPVFEFIIQGLVLRLKEALRKAFDYAAYVGFKEAEDYATGFKILCQENKGSYASVLYKKLFKVLTMINAAKRYISQHTKEQLSVVRLHLIALCNAYIYKSLSEIYLFQEYIKTPFAQAYLLQERLRQLYEHITQNQLDIVNIAAALAPKQSTGLPEGYLASSSPLPQPSVVHQGGNGPLPLPYPASPGIYSGMPSPKMINPAYLKHKPAAPNGPDYPGPRYNPRLSGPSEPMGPLLSPRPKTPVPGSSPWHLAYPPARAAVGSSSPRPQNAPNYPKNPQVPALASYYSRPVDPTRTITLPPPLLPMAWEVRKRERPSAAVRTVSLPSSQSVVSPLSQSAEPKGEKRKHEEEEDTELSCIICFGSFKKPTDIASLDCTCNAYFHQNCLEDWWKKVQSEAKQCPVCKKTELNLVNFKSFKKR